VTYAGHVQAKCGDVARREGQHEGLISLTTFEKIQERLKSKATAPARKDISENFPLRVISPYKDKTSELVRQKLLTQDQVEHSNAQVYPFEEPFQLACQFLANPYALRKNNDVGGIVSKGVILRLVFLEGLA
jgi:hypothetical protein